VFLFCIVIPCMNCYNKICRLLFYTKLIVFVQTAFPFTTHTEIQQESSTTVSDSPSVTTHANNATLGSTTSSPRYNLTLGSTKSPSTPRRNVTVDLLPSSSTTHESVSPFPVSNDNFTSETPGYVGTYVLLAIKPRHFCSLDGVLKLKHCSQITPTTHC
jgi:hypothetical protein